MPRFDLPDHARRLDDLLRQLRYAGEDGKGAIDWRRACRVVNRRTLRPMEEARFRQLMKGTGREMTADEAVQLAAGLGFDVRRLLYEPGSVPQRPDRPELFWDEMDQFGMTT